MMPTKPERKRPQARRGAASRRTSRKTPVRVFIQRGSRSDRSPRVAAAGPVLEDPTACERCGAVYFHKAWRRGRAIEPELLMRAAWAICPACRQVERGQFYGMVLIRGPKLAEQEDAILRRVANVAERAEFTQPERRIVATRDVGGSLEVRTTSQKLAHRIVRELQKAFGGRASFAWSRGDGRLFARWDAP
jgi:hypothetical protein